MKRLLAVLMVLVAVSACRRPAMEETFVRVADRDALGRYGFQVDLADSTLTYDLDLLVGMACDDVVFSSFRQLPLRLQWTAPSGQPYEETVWMRRKELSDSTFYEKHFSFRIPALGIPLLLLCHHTTDVQGLDNSFSLVCDLY